MSQTMSTDAFLTLPIERVSPNPDQPRKTFEVGPLEELAESIRAIGIMEPLIVRPVAGAYQIIAGERRWRAAGIAGLTTVPAIVKTGVVSDDTAFELGLIENALRRDMNPVEEAEAYQKLLETGLTVEELSTRTGKKAAAIRTALTLLKLEPGIRELVAKRHLTAWDGGRLATLSWSGQTRALDTINRHGLTGNDRDRVIGQVWLAEHEQPMFGEGELEAPETNRSANVRADMERAMSALQRARAALQDCIPDALTVELAEAASREIGAIVKVTRQANVARLLV
jgi:ParB family chromosome partitioning protein